MRSIVILVTAWLLATAAQAGDLAHLHGLNAPAYHRLASETLGRPLHIFVRLPESYADTDRSYPAVYLLDGGVTFPLLGAYYRLLSASGEIPEAIVVGISYGTSDWRQGNMRSTDFTAPAEDRDHYGGAERFQAALEGDLLPLIEGRYRADPARRIVFGQSIGGQFVLYTALTRPDLFWGHIASNPALHRNLPFFLEDRVEGAQTGSRLFVSSASEDEPRFREPALTWIAHWSEKPDLPWTLKTVTLDGETHLSAVPGAFREGMAWLFEGEVR